MITILVVLVHLRQTRKKKALREQRRMRQRLPFARRVTQAVLVTEMDEDGSLKCASAVTKSTKAANEVLEL